MSKLGQERDKEVSEKIKNKGYYDAPRKAYYSLNYDSGRNSGHEEISTEHMLESKSRRPLGAGEVERMMIGK